MKKIILLSIIFIMTGCLGEIGKGYINKTCTKQENINGKIKTTTINIKSKQGNVEKITITEKYDENLEIKSILNSKKSEQNSYKNEPGINMELNNNEFIYNIDTKNITENIKTKFNIKEEQHKQIKYYEEDGYNCK